MPTTKTRTTKADATVATRKVTAKAKTKATEPVLGDHPDTLGIIHRAMNAAAQKAGAENYHLGIPTPGAKAGRIMFRQPPKKRAARTPDKG